MNGPCLNGRFTVGEPDRQVVPTRGPSVRRVLVGVRVTHPRSARKVQADECLGQICGSHILVMGQGKVFGEIISLIFVAGFSINVEVFLYDTVADPMVAHVEGARTLSANGVVGDAVGRRVIGDDRCGWLRMFHFGQRSTDDFGLLAVDE